MALVDCQAEVCESRLNHICHREYVAIHGIEIDRAEQKICSDCVDKIWIGGKPEKFNKMGQSTMYKTEDSEEEE